MAASSSSSSSLLTSSPRISGYLAQKDILLSHFKVWFTVWAGLPFTDVLHPERTYAEIDKKLLNPIMGKIVCAMTARYLHPGSRELPAFAEECARDAEAYIEQNLNTGLLEQNPHENVIILLMIVCHFTVEQQMEKAHAYMRTAKNLAIHLQLNLNRDGAGETPWEQESIRRAAWAFWKLESFLKRGSDERLVFRDGIMKLRVPVADDEIPEQLPLTSVPSPAPSIVSRHTRQHAMELKVSLWQPPRLGSICIQY